jgi:hypothetical protein
MSSFPTVLFDSWYVPLCSHFFGVGKTFDVSPLVLLFAISHGVGKTTTSPIRHGMGKIARLDTSLIHT